MISSFVDYFIAFFMHLPMALHLAGLGQPLHGLNAAVLPAAFAGALAIITFLPYIIRISSWGLAELRGFCSYFFGLRYKLFASGLTSALGSGRRRILGRTQ
jgi:hypothetical protein